MKVADLTIRPARPHEGEELGLIGFDAWLSSPFAVNDAGRVDRIALENEFVFFCVKRGDTISVAERNGEILGWGAREHGDGRISDLWVSPSAQGLGVGRALLASMEGDIALAGFDLAELETYAGNDRAVRFYLRHGYEIIWRAEKFSLSLGYIMDKLGFAKPINEKQMQVRT